MKGRLQKNMREREVGKMSKQCEPGLDRRCRDEDGSIRRKRGDTTG